MVKGVTRQVVVVKSPDPDLFEQAIFLVRNDALTENEVTKEKLVREARTAVLHSQRKLYSSPSPLRSSLFFLSGALTMALLWILTLL